MTGLRTPKCHLRSTFEPTLCKTGGQHDFIHEENTIKLYFTLFLKVRRKTNENKFDRIKKIDR